MADADEMKKVANTPVASRMLRRNRSGVLISALHAGGFEVLTFVSLD